MGEEAEKKAPDQNTTPQVKDILLTALLDAYSPSESKGQLELKSTLDIVEEMSSVADIHKWEIQAALVTAGFTVHYAGNCYLWKMYRVN